MKDIASRDIVLTKLTLVFWFFFFCSFVEIKFSSLNMILQTGWPSASRQAFFAMHISNFKSFEEERRVCRKSMDKTQQRILPFTAAFLPAILSFH